VVSVYSVVSFPSSDVCLGLSSALVVFAASEGTGSQPLRNLSLGVFPEGGGLICMEKQGGPSDIYLSSSFLVQAKASDLPPIHAKSAVNGSPGLIRGFR
jgi:hypothetical protein